MSARRVQLTTALRRIAIAAALTGAATPATHAMTFNFELGGESIEAVSNSTFIAGVGVRVESPETRMIGKGHLDPNVCGRGPDGRLYFQSCQGLFKDQSFPAERIANAPGYASSNFDQGNLNYARGDVTQGGIRINQDLILTWRNFGFFVKGIAFYDPFNANFTEYHPNYITPENVDFVGFESRANDEVIRNPADATTILDELLGLGGVLPPVGVPAPVLGARTDSRPCPASRNPSGAPCGLVYGPGGVVYKKRTDKETKRLAGRGLLLQDLNVFGTFDIGNERELLVKLGRQQVNWGEATISFFDSLNIANPPDLQNLFRLGGNGLDDFYQPVNMLSLSTSLFEGASISAFYQLEWQPLVVPAAGSFYSPVNIGTNNDGPDFVTTAFSQLPHDPEGLGYQLDSPLTAITNTSGRLIRLRDNEPKWENQFGIQFKYYADWLNNGTDIGLYYANYHSRLPIVSAYSTSTSCAKNARTSADFVTMCPRWPLFAALDDPLNASPSPDEVDSNSDALSLDSARIQLEYPENIQMFGVSANTSFGDISVQAEVAYRPDQPLQVALVDLVFSAYGPTLTNCHIQGQGCIGSNAGLGVMPDGSVGAYGSSDFAGILGPYRDTLDAVVGALPGAGRSFPSFLIPYRGGVIGTNPGNSYIRGWEEQETYTFDIGLTYVEGNTDFGSRLLGADQVIWLLELGGVWVPNMPSLDRLQFEAPGLEWHASAGADGSGADGSRQACSTNTACVIGVDGLRFNPHQQDRDLYPDDISLGWSLVSLIRYESVLPNISVQPQIIFKHDFYNTTPGLASNYIEGRILWDTGIEVRYRANTSFNFGYRAVAGGGVANNLGDRDEARVFIKYAF